MFEKNWSKNIKKLVSSKGVDPSKMEITPYRDWLILASVFSVGFIFSLTFNVYMLIAINSDNFFTTEPAKDNGVVLNKVGLTKVLAGFEDKKALFEKARTERSSVVDPSL